ncbi:hypothetical protein [Cupriavidus sp. PET2-C1]
MSFSLDLEIDDRISKDEVLDLLREMRFEISQEDTDGVRGNFPRSNIFAVAKWVSDPNEMAPRTEGADFAATWKIGVRANFYYVMSNYDECSADMHEFLARLNEKYDAYFIFSFEKEKIYAVKDERGMRIVGQF